MPCKKPRDDFRIVVENPVFTTDQNGEEHFEFYNQQSYDDRKYLSDRMDDSLKNNIFMNSHN